MSIYLFIYSKVSENAKCRRISCVFWNITKTEFLNDLCDFNRKIFEQGKVFAIFFLKSPTFGESCVFRNCTVVRCKQVYDTFVVSIGITIHNQSLFYKNATQK